MSLHENFGSGNTDANPDLKPNDMVMTPRHIAKQMIDFYTHDLVRLWGPTVSGISQTKHDVVLDPCRGDGAFYDQYPDHVRKTGAKSPRARLL